MLSVLQSVEVFEKSPPGHSLSTGGRNRSDKGRYYHKPHPKVWEVVGSRRASELQPEATCDLQESLLDSGPETRGSNQSDKGRFLPKVCTKQAKGSKWSESKLGCGFKKLFGLWPWFRGKKKKSKEQRGTKDQTRKIFNFKCLRGDETDLQDEKERYERRNKTGNTQSEATTSAVLRGPDSNQVTLPVKTFPSLSDELYLSDTNSFKNVHFVSLSSLSSFQGQFECEQNTVVSRTVEADGISLENYEEDNKSEETIVKEVVSAPKQSASIQLKSSPLQRRENLYVPSCIAVQCTEDVGEYNPIPHSSPRMESLASENSSKSCRKHTNVAVIKPLNIYNKLSHTEPLSSRCSKVHVGPQVTTAPFCSQDTSPNDKESMKLHKSEMDNSTESENQSEFIDVDRGNSKDKLKEGSISKKQEVTKLRPGSFEDFVFQKDKSKSSGMMDSNLQPCCSFAETVTCYNCSTYGCTTMSVNQHKKYSPLSSKCQAEDPSILLKKFFNMFLIWLPWILHFLTEEQVKESRRSKVFALTQHETSSKSEENLKQVETTPDSKQKQPHLFDRSQLLLDAVPPSDLNSSSDVLEPLQVDVPPVGHSNPVNLDKHLNYRCLNNEQPRSRSAPSKSKQNPGQRKKKKHLPCRRSTLKPFVQLHTNLKSRTSRRRTKRMNSLENFVFQYKNGEKNCKHGRQNYLNGFLDVRSYLDVFMFPYNRPNGLPATATNGTTGAEGENRSETLGVTASRLSINETPSTTGNRDVNVFEQITAGTVTQSMRFEWARFKSFWSFPLSCPIAPTALAKYGFYYTGNEDKVCCFCCGVTHGNWQKGESVYAVHYTISRTCRFMRGDDVGNVPIHGSHSALNQRVGNEETVSVPTAEERELTSLLQTPDSVTSILLGRERDQGNPASLTPSVPDLRESPNRFGGGSLQNGTDIRNLFRGASNLPTTQTSNASSSSASSTNTQQPVTPSSVPSQTTTQTAHVSDPQRKPAAPNTSAVSQSAVSQPNQVARQSQMDTIANEQRPPNQQQPSTLAQRQHHQQQENQQRQGVGGADNGNLGVNTTRPRYPNYAVLTVRSSTFHGFPNHLDQTPLQMARAGFFYAGYGDYVRCFFCGGGLRNWEPGDDPWVEHARWFPRCVYVKQNKGQPFINMVLQRQRELTLPNEYIRTTSGDSTTTSTASVQTARIMDNQSGSIRDTTPVNDPTTTSTANTETRPTATTQQQTRPSVTDEEMTSPAVLSIREMGYSNDVIKAAIQQLRRNQGPVPLSAEALVEIIFGLGDDIPPERPNETQTGQNITPAPRTETPPSNESLSSGSNTPEPQTGAATSDPRPPRRPRDGEASSRAYTEEELKSIQDENNQLKEQMKCKICMDNPVCISFLPCGHLCCCAECAPAMVKCPICRQIIRGSVKTYLS